MSDRFRLERALAAIDAANAEDPHTIELGGQTRPKELAHAELMTAWIARLVEHPTDAQRLAARAHHLRRWVVPRDDYPSGRAGYLRWRRDQGARQADEVAAILADCGYDPATVARVQQIIRKEGLARDPEVQAHEDALCLVFLQTQLADLAARLDAGKALDVLAKTVAKMSPRGRSEAFELELAGDERDLLVRLPQLRGGPDILGDVPGLEGLQALHGRLEERGVAGRVIFDLGLVRELGYYTGAVFEVYDPAVGFTLGGGGRYDELIGRFGRDLPACGLALDVQRVHLAQAAEEALGA